MSMFLATCWWRLITWLRTHFVAPRPTYGAAHRHMCRHATVDTLMVNHHLYISVRALLPTVHRNVKPLDCGTEPAAGRVTSSSVPVETLVMATATQLLLLS